MAKNLQNTIAPNGAKTAAASSPDNDAYNKTLRLIPSDWLDTWGEHSDEAVDRIQNGEAVFAVLQNIAGREGHKAARNAPAVPASAPEAVSPTSDTATANGEG